MITFTMPSCTFSEPPNQKPFHDDKEGDDDAESLDIETEQGTPDPNLSPAAKDDDDDYDENDHHDTFDQAIEYTNKFHCQMTKLEDLVVQQQHFSNFSNHSPGPCTDPTADHKRTSQLSFGIDRILNQDDATSQYKHLSAVKTVSEANIRLQIPCLDSLSPSSTLSTHLASCSPRKSSSPVSFGPPRIGSVDILPMSSGFHSPFLSTEACRSDSTSLDILPMRSMWPEVFVCPWTGMQRDRYGLVRRVGHPYQNRTPPKRKKPRTAFTRQQVLELEKRFTRQKYLASAERSALAKTLSMTDAQVKTWFQNRRTKWRRQTAEERDIERQAAHKFLLSLRTEETPRPVSYGTLCGITQTTSLARKEESAVPSA